MSRYIPIREVHLTKEDTDEGVEWHVGITRDDDTASGQENYICYTRKEAYDIINEALVIDLNNNS